MKLEKKKKKKKKENKRKEKIKLRLDGFIFVQCFFFYSNDVN